MHTAAQILKEARAVLAAGEVDPGISKADTIAALTVLLAQADEPSAAPAIELRGRLVEVGNLEGGADIGVTIEMAAGRYASLVGLTEDQARAAVPFYQRGIFIALGGAV